MQLALDYSTFLHRDFASPRATYVAGVSHVAFPSFPFQSARVFLELSVLTTATVWLEAGSPRHVLGLNPGQLVRLTRSETVDLVLEA